MNHHGTGAYRPRAASVSALFLVAVLLRVAYVLFVDYEPYSDMLQHDANAVAIVAGHGMPASSSVAEQYPLYSYVLAGVYALCGRDLLAVRLLQAVLGAATCVLTALWAADVWRNRHVGLVAGSVTAVYPDLILHAGSILTETTYTFCLVLALWCWQRALDRHRWHAYVPVGIALGLAGLTRTPFIFMLPFALAFQVLSYWPRRRLAAVHLCVLAASVLLVWLPWMVRNMRVYGRPVVVSYQLGANVWGGNNPIADGYWTAERHMSPEQRALVNSLPAAAANAYMVRQAREWVVGHPWEFVRLLGVKVTRLLALKPDNIYKGNFFGPRWELLLPAAAKAALWILVVVGLLTTFGAWRRLGLVYSLLLGHLGMTLLMFAYARYLVPLVPALSVLAAAGVARVADTVRAVGAGEPVLTPKGTAVLVVILLLGVSWTLEARHYAALARVWVSGTGADCRERTLGECLPHLRDRAP